MVNMSIAPAPSGCPLVVNTFLQKAAVLISPPGPEGIRLRAVERIYNGVRLNGLIRKRRNDGRMSICVDWKNPYKDRAGQWLKGNLHTHTSPASGCGKISVQDCVDRYVELGYDFLAISDHCRYTAFKDPRITLIPGVEWNDAGGHHTGVCSLKPSVIKAAIGLDSIEDTLRSLEIIDPLTPYIVDRPPTPSLTSIANVTQFPDVIVPAGITRDKMPVTISFFGPAWSEPKLLAYAYSYEQATRHRVAPATTPPLPGERFEY